MSQSTIKALERIFALEIEGRLPLQSKAAIYPKLEGIGLVEKGREVKGRDRFGEIALEGWYLTPKGRRVYCENC